MTRLECSGPDEFLQDDSNATSRLQDKYFLGLVVVPKQKLIECFTGKKWKSDQDGIKLLVLYFIYIFLFSTPDKKKILKRDFCIMNNGAFETFAWGIVVYDAIMRSMKDKL